MGKPKAPPPPNYAELATQEAAGSKDAAIYNTNINRANQTGPEGSSIWSLRPGADINNPQAGDYTQTTSYSPEQQALYSKNNQISQEYLNAGLAGLDRVSTAMANPFDSSGLPTMRTSQAGGQGLTSGISPQGLTPGQAIDPMTGQVRDTLGATRAVPGAVDDASRQRVEQAILERMQPQLQQAQGDLDSKLLNSGIEKGTEGWNREQDRLGRERNDARLNAVLAGGQEESRQVGLNQGLQGQEFGQALQTGQFGNQATGQRFGQQSAAVGQNFGQQQIANQQNFGQNLQAGQFGNQAQNQAFTQDLAGAGFDNQARQQAIQEQAYLRSLPLNETNALRTGTQVTGPQFGNYYTGASAQGPQSLDAGIAQGNYDMAAYQQKQAGYNALIGGLAGAGGAYLGRPTWRG